MQAATGQMQEVHPVFEPQKELCQAGVLLAIPALLSQGLFEFKKIYAPLRKGYYGLSSVILTLAIMALCRIKNPEQLKQCKVGELGRIIGLDRLPETKNLRNKLQQIVWQQKAHTFNEHLLNRWLNNEECIYFYVDGHVRIYYGNQAQLTSKYVSRQKICLSATTRGRPPMWSACGWLATTTSIAVSPRWSRKALSSSRESPPSMIASCPLGVLM